MSVSDREWYEERAAILEFDAGLTRFVAEITALEMLVARGASGIANPSGGTGNVPATLESATNDR